MLKRRLIVVATLGLFLGLDLGAAPEAQRINRGLIGLIRVYQGSLSPLLGKSGVNCRFEPTCSHYAVGSLEKHGAVKGSVRSAWRVLRCAPWTEAGTVDPP